MRNKSFYLCLSALAVLSVLSVSCSKETKTLIVTSPTITVSVAAVSATAEAGTYGFTYVVNNPVSGGSLYCSSTASWISNISDNGLGVNFTVSENDTEDIRTGQIELIYESSVGNVSKTITVTQNTYTTPQIVVQSTAVAAALEGGTYAFNYSIINPASDGKISCSADVKWISDFYCTSSRISFDVAESDDPSAMREGVITVAYTYSGGSVEELVTVVQDHESGGLPTSVDELVGTYRADGEVYFSSGTAGAYAWTLKIYKASSSEVIIDGLVPRAVGYYPGSEAYIARASLNSKGQIVIPSQFTGYFYTMYSAFVGWIPCLQYSQGSGWSVSTQGLDCTLTYDTTTGVWTSDYGMTLAGFTTQGDFTTYSGFFDLSNPGFTIAKRSNSTSVSSIQGIQSCPIEGEPVFHTIADSH